MSLVPHIRIYAPNASGDLDAENSHYLRRVLRLGVGDRFCLTDGKGREWACRLDTETHYLVESEFVPGRESSVAITVFLPLLKGDRFETLLEKLVELGSTRFFPLLSARSCVGTPSAGKMERWRKVALAAMLQCGGCVLPTIEAPVHLDELPTVPAGVIALVLHEEESAPAAGFPPPPISPDAVVWLVSGPEGGFSDPEVDHLKKKGWRPLWLGHRRLRADTAPIMALSGLHCLWQSLHPLQEGTR